MGGNDWAVRDLICHKTPYNFPFWWINCSFFPLPLNQTNYPACTWSWSLSCWEESRRMWKMNCQIRWEKVFLWNGYYSSIVIALFSDLVFANLFVSLHTWNMTVDFSSTFTFLHHIPAMSLDVNMTEELLINKHFSWESILLPVKNEISSVLVKLTEVSLMAVKEIDLSVTGW